MVRSDPSKASIDRPRRVSWFVAASPEMRLRTPPYPDCMGTGKPPAKLPSVPKLWVKEQLSDAGLNSWEFALKHCDSQLAMAFSENGTETWLSSSEL